MVFFWGFASAYVSKCRKITRCRRNMVDSAFESWWSILSDPKKIFVIRTHPEELHVLKCVSNTHISTNFSHQWGQQMMTKCYPTSKGCSCDFQRVKVWPFGVLKPCETFPYDASLLVVKLNIGVKKRDWNMRVIHNTAFWALSKAYVSKCRNMTRRHRSMVDSALESWWFILLISEKILTVRSHL